MANDRKSAFLGMAFGTANHRLRKALLFRYIQRAGDDICFACGERIESVDDLSIEHKEPWEGRSVDLYWDLDNIAFSHRQCNVPHVRGGHKLRALAPEGMARCPYCGQDKPADDFAGRPERWNGLEYVCRSCKSKREVENKRARRIQYRAEGRSVIH